MDSLIIKMLCYISEGQKNRVMKTISDFNSNKSTGPSIISTKMLKLRKNEMSD